MILRFVIFKENSDAYVTDSAVMIIMYSFVVVNEATYAAILKSNIAIMMGRIRRWHDSPLLQTYKLDWVRHKMVL